MHGPIAVLNGAFLSCGPVRTEQGDLRAKIPPWLHQGFVTHIQLGVKLVQDDPLDLLLGLFCHQSSKLLRVEGQDLNLLRAKSG